MSRPIGPKILKPLSPRGAIGLRPYAAGDVAFIRLQAGAHEAYERARGALKVVRAQLQGAAVTPIRVSRADLILSNSSAEAGVFPTSPDPISLKTNYSKLVPDLRYWPSGDAILFRFDSVFSVAQQLARQEVVINPQGELFLELSGIKGILEQGDYDFPTDFTPPTLFTGLYLEPLVSPWDKGVTWDTQPLGDDTATSSDGTKINFNIGNLPRAAIVRKGAVHTVDMGSNPLQMKVDLAAGFSNFVMPDATTTTLRVQGYPFGWGVDPDTFEDIIIQALFTSQYNVDGNFIGGKVIVTPWAGDPDRPDPVTSTIVGYASDGTLTLDPPLDWAPQAGSAPEDYSLTDFVTVYVPVYGFALRVGASDGSILDSSGAQCPFRAHWDFDSMRIFNLMPAEGAC